MIILISGQQSSGKTTLSNKILTQCGPVGAIKLRFAQPIYEMHDAIRNILSKYKVENYDYTKKDGTLLQILGTEWARKHIDNDVWVKAMRTQVASLPKNIIKVVEDVRFKNEFHMFDGVDEPVLKIRLVCPKEIRMNRSESWREDDNHISEIDMNDYAENGMFDMYLQTNILTIDECFEKVKSLVTARGFSLNKHSEVISEVFN